MVTQMCKIWSEIWVAPSPQNLAARNILARFRRTLQLDREFLPNATEYRQSENDIATYGHSRTGKRNLV